MTTLIINPGVCGLSTKVVVSRKDRRNFSLVVESQCEMVRRLGTELPGVTLMDAFKRIVDNPVYRKASAVLKHVSCPVPAGILKTLEVEAGLAVPKDVHMEFLDGLRFD